MHLFDLFEAVGPSELYHGTQMGYAMSILKDNEIGARTSHIPRPGLPIRNKDMSYSHYDGDERIRGVSLTRNKKFAIKWATNGLVFVLDAVKLRQNYRIVPISFFSYNDKINRSEYEEFVVGPIRNLDRYIKSIEITKRDYETMLTHPEYYAEILTHPKLKTYYKRSWG